MRGGGGNLTYTGTMKLGDFTGTILTGTFAETGTATYPFYYPNPSSSQACIRTLNPTFTGIKIGKYYALLSYENCKGNQVRYGNNSRISSGMDIILDVSVAPGNGDFSPGVGLTIGKATATSIVMQDGRDWNANRGVWLFEFKM